MKQYGLSLLKGLLLSFLLFTAFFLFLAFLMFQNSWDASVMMPLVYVALCLSVFLGSFFFSGHVAAKRFLWGLFFGMLFFLCFIGLLLLLNGPAGFGTDRFLTYLAFILLSGMAGGMLS